MIKDKTVVICCAGMGSRLGKNIPKCLVEVDGKKIIERQLEQLRDVENIVVVVGYKGKVVEEFVKKIRSDIKVCYNNNYEKTATGASFILGSKLANTKYVIGLDGDLLVYPNDMESLLSLNHEYACGEQITTDFPMLMSVDENNNVTDFDRKNGNLEWSGITCLEKEHICDDAWYMCDVVKNALPVKAIEIRAKEIDTPNDLKEAERWIKNNYDHDKKEVINNFFKKRFDMEDNYLISRYHINDRDKYDVELISNYIDFNSNVLDLGCGTGILEDKLYNLVKHIDAVDKYQEFLNRAKKYKNVDYVCRNLSTYLTALKYDCVLMFGVTMYIDDDELNETLNNVRKMLNNDGTFIIKNQWGIDKELIVDNYSENLKSFYYSKYRKLDDMIKVLEKIGYRTEIYDIYPESFNKWDNTHEYAILCKNR